MHTTVSAAPASHTSIDDPGPPEGASGADAPEAISRRGFLKGAALAGGGLAVATVAACAPTGLATWTEGPRASGLPAAPASPPASAAIPGASPVGTSAPSPASTMAMGSPSATASASPGASPALSASDQMDADAKAAVDRFLDPNKTVVVGNRPIEPTIDGDWKVFELTCAPVNWETTLGQVVPAVAFNGMVPGPRIRVTEGDKVRAIVTNHLGESTGIHWHGVEVPNKMDGVPFVTQPPIKDGETFTYEFVAKPFGSQMYHSHHNATDQVGRGMLGAFIIDPLDPKQRIQVDQDIVWISNEQLGGFTINGKQFPDTAPLVAKQGEVIRVRYMNEGIMTHPWHLHGMPMRVIARDGHPLGSAEFLCDTLGVNPGERWDVLIECKYPGAWAFHCHILPHAEGPHGMYGMVTALVIS